MPDAVPNHDDYQIRFVPSAKRVRVEFNGACVYSEHRHRRAAA